MHLHLNHVRLFINCACVCVVGLLTACASNDVLEPSDPGEPSNPSAASRSNVSDSAKRQPVQQTEATDDILPPADFAWQPREDQISVESLNMWMYSYVDERQVIKVARKLPAERVDDRSYEWTPLQRAAERGYPEVALELIKKGADVNATVPGTGNTPLMIAVGEAHPRIVMILLEAGADLHAKNHRSHTALNIAKHFGSRECIRDMLEVKLAMESIVKND